MVPTGSSSRGGDVAVYDLGVKQPSFPTPFNSVFVCISVFMALSTVFYFINYPPDNSLPSHCSVRLISVLSVLSTIYFFMESLPQP